MKRVTIVAMGDSRRAFHEACMTPQGYSGEVWAINLMAAVVRCDRAIIMDDLGYLEGVFGPDVIRRWKSLHVPLVTSTPRLDYPTSEAYPIQRVLAATGLRYLNNTVAYAVALAITEGFDEIALFGCDFGYADDRPIKEDGRACVEFWLGVAMARGIAVELPIGTTLMDSHKPAQPLYGYAEQPEVPTCAQSS